MCCTKPQVVYLLGCVGTIVNRKVQVTYTKAQLQRFREVHWAVQIRFPSYSNTRISQLFFRFHLLSFLSASLSLLSIFCSASALYFPMFPTDTTSSWLPPISFHTSLSTLYHLAPARPFVTSSHTALSTMAGNLFFGKFRTLYYCYYYYYYYACLPTI